MRRDAGLAGVRAHGRRTRFRGCFAYAHCHRLPVLACADGVVVEVEANQPENAIGQQDLDRNWGNYVLVHHAAGLYSLVAHLAAKSVKVKPGQAVKCGDTLGLCGSSGRSPRPHLHFQLQATPKIGAPTIPCAFNDLVISSHDGVAGDLEHQGRQGRRSMGERGPRLLSSATPGVDDELRNAESDADIGAHLAFSPGDEWSFCRHDGKAGAARGRPERVGCEIDLYGRRLLVSRDLPATLFYSATDDAFTVLDVVGDRQSVLHALRAALSRVPYDATPGLVFSDTLPARGFRPLVWRILSDFVAPFRANDGVQMAYRMHRDAGALVVTGESTLGARGAARVRTRAELTRGAGPARIEIVVGGISVVAERVPVSMGSQATPNPGAGRAARTNELRGDGAVGRAKEQP